MKKEANNKDSQGKMKKADKRPPTISEKTIGGNIAKICTCQQKLDTKLKKLGIKIEYLYKAQ